MTSYTKQYILRIGFILALATYLPAISESVLAQPDFYVDPVNGLDANNGTSITTAFQTIEKARDAVRTVNTNMSGDIHVYLRGGTYGLTSTLYFTNGDGGTNGFNVIYSAYNGEKAIISGGRQITGWTLYDTAKNIYTACANGDIETRQLFINGVRAIRARSTGSPSPLTFVKSSGYTATGSVFANSTIPMHNWENPGDIEFVYKAEWTLPRIDVSTITNDGTTTTFTMKQPGWNQVTNKGGTSVGGTYNSNGLPWYIENAYELLDAEGEWYLDRSVDYFYYKPRTGEDLSTASAVAPVLEELIRIEGSDSAHKVGKIQFKNITFSYATELRANSNLGMPDAQNNVLRDATGEHIIKAAVNLKNADSIRFERDVFEHLGGTGMDMFSGSQDNLVLGSVFTDISGNGIQVGDYDGFYNSGTVNYGNNPDTLVWLRNNDINNTYFYQVATEYCAGTAIAATVPRDMDIVHNEIGNVPYSGIHVGWGWGLVKPTLQRNTRIQYNYVHDVMTTLSDGGQIYNIGSSGGDSSHKSIISNNYALNCLNQSAALYLDEQSDWWTVTNNVVNNAPRFFLGNANANTSVTYTYTSTGSYTNNGGGAVVSANTLVSGGNWPAAALAIMDSAGLEHDYQDIKPQDVPATQRLYETFDAMNTGNAPAGWTISSNTGDGNVTVAAVPTDGNKSMQVTKTGSSSGQALSASHGFDPLITGTVELRAKAEQTNALASPIVIKAGSTTAVEIAFNSDGNIAYKNTSGSWTTIQSYSADTWYDLKLGFDTNTDSFSLIINSVQKLAGTPFVTPTGAVDLFMSQISSAGMGTLYIDSVNAYDGNLNSPVVSLNKQITGYSSQLNATNWKAANINDGLLGPVSSNERGWASVSGSGTRNEWVKIDLDQTYTLSSFTLQNENGAASRNVKDYVLYGSATGAFAGEEFVISSGTIPALQSTQHYSVAFTPINARYIKFEGVSSYSSYVIVGELSIIGTPVAASNVPVLVSKFQTITGYSSQLNTTSWKVANINDGQVGTVTSNERGWASVSGSGTRNEWVNIDLGRTCSLSSFVIQNEDGASGRNVKDYVLYGSTTGAFAGEEFILSSGTIPSLGALATDTVTFTEASARYIRFKGTSSYSSYVIVGELSLYGKVDTTLPVSLNKTVTGYSSQYTATEWKAANIDDGTVGSVSSSQRGWASASGSGTRNEWVTIDLGQTYSLSSFAIQNEDGAGRNVKDYVLYGSATGAFAGEEFIISSGTIPSLSNLAFYTVNFTAASARYVKFKGTSSYSTFVIVGELSLYGF